MSNYYLIIVWVGIVVVLSSVLNVYRKEFVVEKWEYRLKPLFAFVVFFPLIIWTGYRGNVGDTYAYIQSFDQMPISLGELPTYMATVTKDEGFYFLSAVIKLLIKNKVEIYLLIVGLLQASFLIRLYRKYSVNYVMSFFLFIASTDYVSWMFNGMRQFTAVTLILFSFEWILEKKYIPSIILILIASTVHGSALLVIPFVFICQGKAWNKKTLLFIIMIVLTIAFAERFTGILDIMLAETQYKNVVSDWKDLADDGTNIIRVLVYVVPTILSLIGLRFINKAQNPVINMCVNMSIVSAGFYVVSMFTSGVYIGRLPIYFSL